MFYKNSSSSLSLLGVAAVHCYSPPHLVLCLLFTDTCPLHILLYIIISPPLQLPSCPLPWYFNFHHSPAYVAFFPSLHMPKPSQSLSPQLLPNSSDLHHPPDVLIPHLVLQCHPNAHLTTSVQPLPPFSPSFLSLPLSPYHTTLPALQHTCRSFLSILLTTFCHRVLS